MWVEWRMKSTISGAVITLQPTAIGSTREMRASNSAQVALEPIVWVSIPCFARALER